MGKTFSTEVELCAAFIAYHEARGFTAYPETAGFDILLVRGSDNRQFGVQAKLTLNIKVLNQLLPPDYFDEGPDHRVILAPDCRGMRNLCDALGFILQVPEWDRRFSDLGHGWNRAPYDWNPTRPCKLPDYVPDVAAGASGPIQLTPWKVCALSVMAHLEARGAITRKEIRSLGCDPTRWCQHWLEPHQDRAGLYVMSSRVPRFDQQHPIVYAQVLAKAHAALPAAA